MNKILLIGQLIVCIFGFILFSFFSGIVGSYAIEYKKNPSVLDKTIYVFHASSYPVIALGFFVWAVVIFVLLIYRRKNSTSNCQ